MVGAHETVRKRLFFFLSVVVARVVRVVALSSFSLSLSLSVCVFVCVRFARARSEVFWRFSGNISREKLRFPHALDINKERERDADRQTFSREREERERERERVDV